MAAIPNGWQRTADDWQCCPKFGSVLPTVGEVLRMIGSVLPTVGETLRMIGSVLRTVGEALQRIGSKLQIIKIRRRY
ncbi:hypothetical protein [Parasediminibacterium sp. JCM 36343]|uniref:hypothetical protein n=1 Tax=Parasediminibacterium sp. JCM 36343 TaxID=3374279 RepID=UPI0039797FA0